jgi:hypothetical protein
VIGITFGDLSEEDQRRVKGEMRHKLEEIEAVKMWEKLACYQKTRGGVVQKADTVKVSASKVSTQPLPPEELAHLVDVSVARKYVTDLAQLTHVLAEDVHHTLDSFMHDIDDNLPRQIRSVVKEVVGNTQGNQAADTARTATQQATLPHEGYRTTQPAN